MHFSELTPPEQRVLGCLIEKRWTTPDQYPLSLNALRLACNQSTNRDPVTYYDETTVREAAQRLSRYGLARLASGHSSRATKYRHLAEEALGLGREELALLAVLLLRGPQTPGELKARSDRLAPMATLADVHEHMAVLTSRGFARELPRRPGQKEERFEHLLGGPGNEGSGAAAPAGSFAPTSPAATPAHSAVPPHGAGPINAPSPMAAAPPSPPRSFPVPPPANHDGLTARVEMLERAELVDRVQTLEREVAELRARLDAIADELGLEDAAEAT